MGVSKTMVEFRGLAGKRVLVTGAAKGQGFNHVKAFAAAGCDIAALDVTRPVPGVYPLATQEMLDATVRAVQERGQQCIGLSCDVRDDGEVEAATSKALEYFDGRIDVLVNNAGVAATGMINELKREDVDVVVDTNLKGTISVTRYIAPAMIAQRDGRIINISSGATNIGAAGLSPYIASKMAINGLTRAWATELSEFGINVNAVLPTTMPPGQGHGSGMLGGVAAGYGMDPDHLYEWTVEQYNLKGAKWRGQLHHITDAVLFLASDNAEIITGHLLSVDAGNAAR